MNNEKRILVSETGKTLAMVFDTLADACRMWERQDEAGALKLGEALIGLRDTSKEALSFGDDPMLLELSDALLVTITGIAALSFGVSHEISGKVDE